MAATATIEPENGSPVQAMSPAGMLMWAAMYLGNARVAQLLDIEERSLRAKLAGERGVSRADLSRLVEDLERRGRAIDGHVATITAHLNQEAPCPTA